MPRIGRVVLPNYPHHIVQRGHNRQVVFAHPDEYKRYLKDLRELKEVFGVKVYAYCLMTNHVHLLVAPGESPTGLSQLMKTLPEDEWTLIRCAVQRGQLTGDVRFIDEVERVAGLRIE